MTQCGGSRAGQTGYLQHREWCRLGFFFSAGKPLTHPLRHQKSYFVVIATYKSRPLVSGDPPVGDDHGNTCAESPVDGGFDLLRLVRTDDEQIHTLGDETVYLRALQVVAAVGDTAGECQIRIEQHLALHLVVHLLSPGVVQTLAYANRIMRFAGSARRQEYWQQETQSEDGQWIMDDRRFHDKLLDFGC